MQCRAGSHGAASLASTDGAVAPAPSLAVLTSHASGSPVSVEQVLSFDVAEAEAAYGRLFDDELDNHIQLGMFAVDRISADGTIGKVAAATSHLLDGECVRTAKIEHCNEIEPESASWRITRADGSEAPREPWSCVPGTPPRSHSDLT
ncbi:MAG: hypothetical protein OXG37_12380 [Actinomycetia bacterium]|nr:hypothetical protein [Actinomycetes bacterium]